MHGFGAHPLPVAMRLTTPNKRWEFVPSMSNGQVA